MENGHIYQDQKKDIWHYLRIVKALVVLATLLSSASTFLLFLAPITFFMLRFFSIHLSRKLNALIFGRWLSIWPFFFEKINNTKVFFCGDIVPQGERAIVMCNHRTEVDWMYIWSLAVRKNRVGSVKYVLKSSVRNAPIFGWAFHVLEFILIDRRWEVDGPVIGSMLSSFKGVQDPLWLVIFPEGTDYTEEKCLKGQKYAEEHGYPKLSNVLLPRTKGVHACLAQLKGSINAVYDLTIGYKNQCPLFIDNALGTDPKEVHMHIKRTPVTDVPQTESEVTGWLMKEFSRKDDLLSRFYREGSFPNNNCREGELSTFSGVANLCLIMAATCGLLWLFFSSFLWIKLYIALSGMLLVASTYFRYRPSPPILLHPNPRASSMENGCKHS